MTPVLKIFVGALMMVLGIFTSVTYSNQLLNLIQGGIGPLLVLVGAFVVWLESDEWKMQKEQKSQKTTSKQQFNGQQTLQKEETQTDVERDTREAAQEIKQAVSSTSKTSRKTAEELVSEGTVREVKEAVNDRNDLNVEAVLEAEKNNQNRKTLVEYLERQL